VEPGDEICRRRSRGKGKKVVVGREWVEGAGPECFGEERWSKEGSGCGGISREDGAAGGRVLDCTVWQCRARLMVMERRAVCDLT